MKLEELKEIMPYKWRVQSFSKNKPQASCVAYIDARDVMDRFDDVCGAENWQDDYKMLDGLLLGGIGIRTDNGWVWKWDTGTESQVEKEKGHVSDAFKRAAIHWGVGRFLYGLKIVYLPANEAKTQSNYPYVVDQAGKKVWDLTDHINNLPQGNKNPRPEKTPSAPKKWTPGTFSTRLGQIKAGFESAGIVNVFNENLEANYGTKNPVEIVKNHIDKADEIIQGLTVAYKQEAK